MSRRVSVFIGSLALLAAGVAPASAQDRTARIDLMSSLLGGSYLGVVVDEVSPDRVAELKLREPRGAYVREIEEDSPAQKAGLEAGDVVVRFDGESVRGVAHLTRLVRETPAERTVALEVWRDGASRTLQATVRQRDHLAAAGDVLRRMPHVQVFGGPDFDGGTFEWQSEDEDANRFVMRHVLRRPLKLGISYQPLTDQLAEHFGVDGGVLVTEVHEDGPARKAGLKAGDVIVGVDGRDVPNRRDFARAIGRLSPGDEVGIGIQRDGERKDLKLTVGGEPETDDDAGIGHKAVIEHEIET